MDNKQNLTKSNEVGGRTDETHELNHNAPSAGLEKGITDHREYHGVVAGKIMNPLGGIPRDQLFRDVDAFAQDKGLVEHTEMLRKGALLSQVGGEADARFEKIDVLSAEEKDQIRYEQAHKWSHPMTLYLTIILCSMGAAVQGWDQTGANGANLSFPDEFGIAAKVGQPNYQRDGWLVGVVNAAPYIASACVGTWLSDPLNNYFGRRGTIFITAIILIITPICSGLTQTWQQLFAVRFLLGIGMGAKGATVPIFAAENSPALIRGALVMSWQLWTAFGIFLGFCANAAVKDAGPNLAWRLQLGSAFLPAVPLAIGIFFCPESPRWLIKKGRYQDAYRSLLRLRKHEIQAARDLYTIHIALEVEKGIPKGENFFARVKELFTIPRVRRATLASGIVMLAQQMCGINIIAFYSSSVFSEAGYTNTQALYASLGFGAINFLFAFPAVFTIDTFGRRSLLLFTFPQMAWSLLACGLCFLIPIVYLPGTTTPDPHAGQGRIGAIALFIYIFAAFYSVGEGPVPFAYSAEVFPLAQREVGMSWAVTVCLGFAAILTITFPRMVQVLTQTGAFGFYAGLNVIAFVLIFLFLPETKQRTLEELDQVFSIPTSQFVSYQVTKTLPYWYHRYLLFNKTATIEPLYQIEGAYVGDDGSDTPPTHGSLGSEHKQEEKETIA